MIAQRDYALRQAWRDLLLWSSIELLNSQIRVSSPTMLGERTPSEKTGVEVQ